MNKIKLANIIDPVARGIFKRAMIDAQSTYVANKGRKFSDPALSQKPNRGPAPTAAE